MQTQSEAGRVPRQKRGVVKRYVYVPPLKRQQMYNAILFISPALAIYLALCCAAASASGMWLALPFLGLFLHGYACMFGWSIAARWRA